MKICGVLDWNTNSTYKKRASKVYKWSIVISHIYILVTSCINLSQSSSLYTFLKFFWRLFIHFTFALNYLYLSQLGLKIKELFCIPEKYLCYKFKFSKAANNTIRKVCIHYGIIFLILISTIVSAVIKIPSIKTAVEEKKTPASFYTTLRTANPNLVSNIFQLFATIQVITVFFGLHLLVFYYFTIIRCYYKQIIDRFENIWHFTSQLFSEQNYVALEFYVKDSIIFHQYVVG
jgi:hypothetical protein